MKPINIIQKLNESSETESKWVYVSKHGFGPGTVPKDIEISNVYNEPNSMSTVFCSNRKLTQEELNKYELKPFMEDKEINEDNFSVNNKVDSIEIYGEDYQFSDTLEELGYEYCLRLFDDITGNNNLLIYKEVSGNEDFFVIDTTSTGGTLYKIDHNGERLFLSENEAEVLSKRFNREN